MEQPKISYLEFDPKNIPVTQLEQKTSKPRQDPQNPGAPPTQVTYHELPLLYKYTVKDKDGKENTVVAPFCVEGPEIISHTGILEKKQSSGMDTASLFCEFDLTDPAVQALVSMGDDDGKGAGFFHKLYRCLAQRIFEIKGQVPSLSRIPRIEGIEGIFGYPIYWSRDSQGTVVYGKNPTKYFNLVYYGKPGSFQERRTNFSVPILDSKTGEFTRLEWKDMKNVTVKFKPVWRFKKIYLGGGKGSIQMEITSAVVTSIQKNNSLSTQRSTLEAYSKDDALTKTLMRQLELIKLSEASSSGEDAASETPGPEPAKPEAVPEEIKSKPGRLPGIPLTSESTVPQQQVPNLSAFLTPRPSLPPIQTGSGAMRPLLTS